jgi:hypothetical protein
MTAIAQLADLSRASLSRASLPQTCLPLLRHRGPFGRTVTGISLESLVQRSVTNLPTAKNALLRVTVTVTGRRGKAVTLALGELDPWFGNHDALLAPVSAASGGGTQLVLPGDTNDRRTVRNVETIQVDVAEQTPSRTPAGSLLVGTAGGSVLLSATQLAALPTRTRSVSFQTATGSQKHIESGPSLASVLDRASVPLGPSSSVIVVGADGYLATVTPAEATAGGRPLLLSTVEDGVPLARPRLVVDGDVTSGRYVYDVVDLVVAHPSPNPVTSESGRR